MKHNYRLPFKLLLVLTFLFTTVLNSQNIQFTFENVQNTNDGSNDFYEADIMIQTIDGQADFKLGSGQVYFNYNTAAFGENVKANSMFTVTQDNASGYVCGQYIDAAAAGIYSNFVINDNTTSRVSWAFGQTFSSSTFATDNVTTVPTKLIHVKFQYIDVNEVPMVAFENDNGVLSQATDQFYTACGSAGSGAFDTADCPDYAGIQFIGATFENAGSVLAVDDYTQDITNITVYPNPTNGFVYINGTGTIENVELFNSTGQRVLYVKNSFNNIDMSNLQTGVYFMKITTENGVVTKKVVKQ